MPASEKTHTHSGVSKLSWLPWHPNHSIRNLSSGKFETRDIVPSVPYRISNKSTKTKAFPFAHATLGVRPKCQLKCVLLSPGLRFSPELVNSATKTGKKHSRTSPLYCNHRHCHHLGLRPTLTRTHPVWLCSTWHGRFITSDDKFQSSVIVPFLCLEPISTFLMEHQDGALPQEFPLCLHLHEPIARIQQAKAIAMPGNRWTQIW